MKAHPMKAITSRFPTLTALSALVLMPSLAQAGTTAQEAITTAPTASTEAWYNNLYFSASAGFQSRDKAAEQSDVFTTWDNGSMVSGAFGYKFSKYFRADAEITGFENDASTVAN